MMLDEGPQGWLERAYEAKPEDLEKHGLASDEAREALRADLLKLGLVGTVVLLAKPGPADPAVAREARDAIARELEAGEGSLRELLDRFAKKRTARGAEAARKLVGRVLHDLYGLEGHGLTSEDVLRALSFAARSRGDGDARESARALARMGRDPARAVLGHLEEQIQLVHRLMVEEVMPSEIDRPLLEFAPRIFARRLPSMLKVLLPKEPRVRLACVLWGRLRGLTISKESLVHALDALEPEKPVTLAGAVAKLDRGPLLAIASSPDAVTAEDAAIG